MRLDLHGGSFWDEGYGFGTIVEMYDLDGDETLDPSMCAECVVDLGRPGHKLRVPVREWWLDVEMAN